MSVTSTNMRAAAETFLTPLLILFWIVSSLMAALWYLFALSGLAFGAEPSHQILVALWTAAALPVSAFNFHTIMRHLGGALRWRRVGAVMLLSAILVATNPVVLGLS